MNPFRNVKQIIDKLFTKHLFATNVVTCGGLLGLGDFVVQQMNMAFSQKETGVKYDFARTGRMVIIGFTLGPFNHFWYSFLDKAIKGRSAKAVLKKIASDQAVAGPFFCSSFLIGLSLLEGRGIEGAKEEWKDKFLTIYMVDWAFWPMAQLINFRFVPGNFRVLCVSTATLIWNSFLSYMKHKEVSADEESVH